MKTQTRILISVVSSVAVSIVIALIAFSILRGMNTELTRSRAYSDIINKTHALNVLTASFKEGSGRSDIRQVRKILLSLDSLLRGVSSLAPREEALIKQLQKNNQDLGPLIDQMFVSEQGIVSGIGRARRNILASQIWMRVRFISDDTSRLMDISQSRIIAAHERTDAVIIALILILALTNGGIYFLSGRGIMHAQEALRQSEERFRVTLGSIGDAVIATDTTDRVTFLNPIAVELTGWQFEEATGQPIQSVFQIINEQTRQPARNIVEHVLREGVIVSLANHTALITRDGSEIPVEDGAAPIRDGAGNIIGVVLVFHDVAEKRRDQEALRESEERLRLFIDHVPAPIAMFDRDMRYLCFSRRWTSDFNLGERDLKGISHYEVFPETSERWKEVHRRCLTGYTERRKEELTKGVDGSTQWLRWETRPWYTASGVIGGIVIFAEDITVRKQAEQKIRESEERLRLALKAANQGLYDLNVQTGEAHVSPEYATLLGYEPSEFHETNAAWIERLHPEDHEPVAAIYNDYIANKIPEYRVEFRQHTKSGEWKWILSLGSIVEWDAEGKPLRMLGTHMDITERKEAEEALKKSLIEKDLLLKETHHRVKNNLQVIIGLIQMQARSSADARIVQTLKELQERVRVMALVHEQLYRSHSFSEINFGQYLKELTDNLIQVFGSPGIVLKVNAGDIFLEIETVITCGLITTEIVTNALKYAFPNSQSLHGEPPRRICVEFTESESDYKLLVSDNGIGLPQGFDVSTVTSMGLHLVHLWSTYQLNGSIETRTDPGTTFIIRFPKRMRR